MKKLLSLGLVAGTVTSLAASCGADKAVKPTTDTKKTETTTETKKPTTTVTKGTVAQGTFKVAYVGSPVAAAKEIKTALDLYTQDIEALSVAGSEYLNLPSGLFLKTSTKYNMTFEKTTEYTAQIEKLKDLIDDVVITAATDGNPYGVMYAADQTTIAAYHDDRIIINGSSATARPANLTNDQIGEIYKMIDTTTPTLLQLGTAIAKVYGYQVDDTEESDKALNAGAQQLTSANTVYVDADTKNVALTAKTDAKKYSDLHAEFTASVVENLKDKTKLAAKNLDALFISVADGQENSQDVYKAVVEDKNYKDTNLFFVGEKAKSQSGASSKVFAGGKVSTATFNDKAAAYIAGFQAAVGAIKYSASEDKYEETSVAFLIGATSNSIDKKRAFAFRRGVEAAAAHKDYSAFLKVKFVSKTEDTSKSSKKLFREISEWKTKNDSKTKLYEFSSSDTFSDTERRVVYIAGASAQDWTGYSKKARNSGGDETNKFYSGDEIGLIGALYNYKDLSAAGAEANSLKARDFTRGVWIVLDNAKSRELISGAFADTFTNVDGGPTGLATTKDSLDSWHEAGTADDHENITKFERHDVKFYGSIGKELIGTKKYAEFALKGLYMGGANYMLGKHTIFGAPLDNSIKLNNGEYDSSQNHTNEPWRYSWTSSNGKDTASKAKSRYEDSLKAAWSVELVEDDIVKDSPWMR